MTDASASQSRGANASSTAGIAVGRMEFHLQSGLSFEATMWLEARGLCPDTASRMGVVSADAGRSEWVAFPSVVKGAVVGWQFRRMDDAEPRFLTAKGAAEFCWNHDILLDDTLADQPLIITEGRCDALAAIQSGFPRTISVPGGAVEPKEGHHGETQYKFVATIEPLLKNAKRIVLATDDDGPGQAMMGELARRFGRGRCQYIERPAGAKDLNALLLGYSERAVVEAVNRAKWLHVDGVFLPSELPPRERLRQHVSGFPGLDDKWRIRRNDLTIVTGWPGCGKSTFLNDVAFRMAENHGWRTAFASFEQTPQTQHMWALRRLYLGKAPDQMTAGEIKRADEWLEQHFVFVVRDEDKPADLPWLFESFATAIVRHGVDMVIADPWNELEHDIPAGKSLTQYVGDGLRDWKRFLRKWDVHGIIAAHPAKVITKGGETLPEPRLDQISDSQHWWNKADVGVVLHGMERQDGAKYVQCRIGKSKFHDEIGKPGVVSLMYNTQTARYHEIAV